MTFAEERETNRERDELIPLVVRTRVPSKWRLVDLETGDVWKHDPAREWVRADDLALAESVVERLRATLRLLSPEEMTPTAHRILSEVLDGT